MAESRDGPHADDRPRRAISVQAKRRGCGTSCIRVSSRTPSIIVNEAAETPVDDRRSSRCPEARRARRRLRLLRGARASLVRLLREVLRCAERVGLSGERLQHIVLETSGLADPGPIVEAVEGRFRPRASHRRQRDHRGRGRAPCSRAIAPRTARARPDRDCGSVGRDQDRCGAEAALTRLLATLRRLNPGAVLSGAVRGSSVDLPPCDDAEPEPLREAAGEAAEVAHFRD